MTDTDDASRHDAAQFDAFPVLTAAGVAIAYIPNEVGKALLYNERVTR